MPSQKQQVEAICKPLGIEITVGSKLQFDVELFYQGGTFQSTDCHVICMAGNYASEVWRDLLKDLRLGFNVCESSDCEQC